MPVVLVSAGIGGTPMVGILAHLTALGSARPVLVLHADRSPADHALRTETGKLVGHCRAPAPSSGTRPPAGRNPTPARA